VPEDGRHVQIATPSSSCIKAASTLPAAAIPSSVTFAQFLGNNVVVRSGRRIDYNHVSVRTAPLPLSSFLSFANDIHITLHRY
jgi:hypothetical protein